MRKKLNTSINEAVGFVRDNYKEIEGACGFPEISGRERITEWGGTISGMHVINSCSIHDDYDQRIIFNSFGWIIGKQDATGGWDTGGIIISEATSEVLYYLLADQYECRYNYKAAVEFIKNNYRRGGYFVSSEQSTDARIYTTYLSIRALQQANQSIDRSQISSWIREIRNADGMWGESSHIQDSRIAQTVYALKILNMCGAEWSKISRDYVEEIKWIFNRLYKNHEFYSFEEYSIPTTEKDSDGQKYKRIRIRHFTLPLAVQLLLDVNQVSKAIILSNKLLLKQYKGGWGISETELTIWGTQQSVDALKRIEGKILHDKNWKINLSFVKFKTYIYQNTAKAIATTAILIFAFLGIIFQFMPALAFGIVIGVFANILTGYFTNWKN